MLAFAASSEKVIGLQYLTLKKPEMSIAWTKYSPGTKGTLYSALTLKFLTSMLLGSPVFLIMAVKWPVFDSCLNNEISVASRSKPMRFSSLGGMARGASWLGCISILKASRQRFLDTLHSDQQIKLWC
jgi:hypothetical protein